jgi:cap1 methyltransferase
MLTVLGWRCKGWGFTLKDVNDFRTDLFNSNASYSPNWKATYGKDGTGNIYKNENIIHLQATVNKVDVITGDGGFSVEGKENEQENLTFRLILCQFLVALMCLKPGGVFACKLFTTFLPYLWDLIYILTCHFSHFAIIKPHQSRPSNSER